MKKLTAPFTTEEALASLRALRIGEVVRLSGVILTGRDAAHKKLFAMLQKGEPLPVDLVGAGLYYVGPCPAAPGEVIGPCGPTTSSRVDSYTPALLDAGLRCMIGKGFRTPPVIEAMKRVGAVYLCATGGAAALLQRHVKQAEVVAFPELGAEAVYRLVVEDMPLIVAIDAQGNDLFVSGPADYRTI